MTTLARAVSATNAHRSALPFHLGAAADLLVGIDLALFGPDVARLTMPAVESLLGADPGTLLRVLGVALIVFAIDTVLIARSHGRLGKLRAWIARANLATAAVGVVILLAAHAALSPIGVVALGVISIALVVVGAWQQRNV